ncbi:MAG: Rrf2 family transcriptional regulator [Desulfobacterales bacterium]|jgi:Rrf2 family protein
MLTTQKHKYALRAIYELGKRYTRGPVKLATIAEAQSIPLRYLEVIMAALKPSGLVTSKRGYNGGYTLLRHPKDISVGDIFRFLDHTQSHDRCNACDEPGGTCPLNDRCAFKPMWDEVQDAINSVYDRTTIQHLLDNGRGHQTIATTMPRQARLEG